MWEQTVVVIDNYPNEKFKITSEKEIEVGNVFTVNGRMFSVVDECDGNLNCFEIEKVIEVTEVDK